MLADFLFHGWRRFETDDEKNGSRLSVDRIDAVNDLKNEQKLSFSSETNNDFSKKKSFMLNCNGGTSVARLPV